MSKEVTVRQTGDVDCPRFLRRQPFLMAYWLMAANLWATRPWQGIARFLLPVVAGVGVMVWISGPGHHAHETLRFIAAHQLWVGFLAAVLSAIMVARRRRRVSTALRESWLAAAPRADCTMRASILLATLWTPCWLWLVGLVTLGAMRLVDSAGTLVFSAGVWVGACAGLLPAGGRRRTRFPGSRYVPKQKTATDTRVRASFRGLSRWPVAEAFAWARPDTLRWPLMAALLSVMAGTPAFVALLVIGQWMILLYMSVLVWSTLRVSREAAMWLGATPMTVGGFARAVGGRSLVHQFVAAFASVALLRAGAFPLANAISLASLWLSFVLIVYSTGIAYGYSRRRGVGASIAASALVLAALASVQRGVCLCFALTVSLWQYRQCVRYASGEEI